jgi:site-specific DNA-methyltransferase (adenine-specific)
VAERLAGREAQHGARVRAGRRAFVPVRDRRELVRLLQADARRWLRSLPAESVDLIVTDPPYQFGGRRLFKRWFDEIDDQEWLDIVAELYRVLRADAHLYLFCNARTKPIFDEAAAKAGFRVKTPLIWDKQSIGLGRGWRSQYEFICLYEKGHRALRDNTQPNVLAARRVAGGYPTEKPVTVLETIIRQASSEGELVLDPFCGSGNVGKAARQQGRRALLCDIDASFAADRLGVKPEPWRPRQVGAKGGPRG